MTSASLPAHTRRADSRRHARTILTLLVWTVTVLARVGWLVYVLPVRTYRHPGASGATFQVSDLASTALVVLLASLGAIFLLRASGRRIGLLLLALGAAHSIVSFAAAYSQYALLVAPQARLPLPLFAAWVQDLWPIPFLFLFSLPFLFPDGQLPSRRWRVVFWPLVIAWIVFILILVLARRPLTNAFLGLETRPQNPTGILPVSEMLTNILFVALSAFSIVTGTASVVARWRGNRGSVRQQIKWVLYGLLLLLAALAASWVNTLLVEAAGIDLGLGVALDMVTNVALLGVIAALGMAVLRYRLYDVDLIINRTLVYGALTALVVATYILLVAGAGALLPLEDNLFLALVATGVIAMLFNPLRAWLQRLVNRLMFGQRDDPYAVLAELGRLLANASAPETTLDTIVATIATALKLPYVAIQLEQDGSFATRAAKGEGSTKAVALPLIQQGNLVGRLVVAPRTPGEPLSPKDRQLLEDISHQAAAVVHEVRLAAALQRSREKLVLAREEERRRIRRDLHDGLGPALASQTFKLDAALDLLAEDAQAVTPLLQGLKQENQQLVADIRRLVYELRPPALDELGLSDALSAHAAQVSGPGAPRISIVAQPDPLPALPAAVEVAAYRIALEAITNVVRHAAAGRCRVTMTAGAARLVLIVDDDGVGLPEDAGPGVGLASMRERAEELGGSVAIAAGERTGTRVTAVLPLGGSGRSRAYEAASRVAHGGSDD